MKPSLRALPTPSEELSDPHEPPGDPFTRDLIAIVAMHAILTRGTSAFSFIAKDAFEMADAFLKERGKS